MSGFRLPPLYLPKRFQWPLATVLGLLAFCLGAWWGDHTIVPFLIAKLNPNNPSVQAQTLFEEAWQRAKTDFRDPSMNHQQWDIWRQRYNGKLSEPTDAYVAIDTMLASLNDEYSRFLPPNEMREQSMQINAELFGVGIQMGMRNGLLTVVAVLNQSPAKAAGILPKEAITHINGTSATGMSLQKAADTIRGPVGTPVQLTVQSSVTQKSRILNLRRAAVHLQSVTVEDDTPPWVKHIRLSSFLSETMVEELEEALRDVDQKQALILDVRGNFGGLVDNAVAIADRFLSHGTIVIVQGPHESPLWQKFSSRWHSADSGKPFHGSEKAHAQADTNDLDNPKTLPIVILMDGNSASASEILCAALHDNHRVTLMGTTTFGKGLVQKIIPLSDGSGMNLSVARYLTPRGQDIHKKGIQPDIRVVDTLSAQSPDVQLQKAIAFLKQHLQTQPSPSPSSHRSF